MLHDRLRLPRRLYTQVERERHDVVFYNFEVPIVGPNPAFAANMLIREATARVSDLRMKTDYALFKYLCSVIKGKMLQIGIGAKIGVRARSEKVDVCVEVELTEELFSVASMQLNLCKVVVLLVAFAISRIKKGKLRVRRRNIAPYKFKIDPRA